MRIVLYVIGIVLANILTSAIPPIPLFGMLVPVGTFLIGFTFIMRDFVQMNHGRKITYLVIGGALISSALATELMGNGVRIVVASALSFALSEVMDTEIFTRWKRSLSSRVMISGTVGSILDSIIFTIAAGFPFQAAYGQLVVKVLMQWFGALAIKGLKNIDPTESTQAVS